MKAAVKVGRYPEEKRTEKAIRIVQTKDHKNLHCSANKERVRDGFKRNFKTSMTGLSVSFAEKDGGEEKA